MRNRTHSRRVRASIERLESRQLLSAAPLLAQLNSQVVTSIPSNGDVNPYGVAVVLVTTGTLKKDDVLVSNFNNSSNLQGTGTTIDEISRSGELKIFATIDAGGLPGPCPGGVGLTTALVALRSGFVIVGSLPTSDGTAATAQAGCQNPSVQGTPESRPCGLPIDRNRGDARARRSCGDCEPLRSPKLQGCERRGRRPSHGRHRRKDRPASCTPDSRSRGPRWLR